LEGQGGELTRQLEAVGAPSGGKPNVEKQLLTIS
jgi:hypothetical protein